MRRCLVLCWALGGCEITLESGKETETGSETDPTTETTLALATPTCDGADVVSVIRPMDPVASVSERFLYSGRLIPGTDPSLPTVVFVPGGPGQTSTGTDRATFQVPPEYTVLFTDPRGVGCNGLVPDDPVSFHNSLNYVDDVLALLDAEGIDDWIVYGHSYGSILGTMIASTAEARGRGPRSVVLEGVAGSSFEGHLGYLEQWDILLENAPFVEPLFAGPDLPLGLDGGIWGLWIRLRMPIGTVNVDGEPFWQIVEELALLGTPYESVLETEIYNLLSAAFSEPEPGNPPLYNEIGCREVWSYNYSVGEIGPGAEFSFREDLCADTPLSRPYDPSDWPILSPLFYVHGTNDPATPIWGAQEHFDSQPVGNRSFIEVLGAGHQPMPFNLADCQPSLWEAFRGDEDVADALGGCSWEHTVLSGD